MKRHSLSLLLAATLLLTGTSACAQNLDARRSAMRTAIDNAERGQFDAAAGTALRSHPLYGWLEYSALRRDIDTLGTAQAQDFLKRYQGQAVAESFRSVWLAALARRKDWPALLANWQITNDPGLQCAGLAARLATGKADAGAGLVGDWLKPLEQGFDVKLLVLVGVVFTVGQLIESYILTPRIVGDRIGLHPVAVIFAIMAGGQLFGFVGMLIALPVAAVGNVLLRYVHEKYTQSRLYAGDGPKIVLDGHLSDGGIVLDDDIGEASERRGDRNA